MKVPVTFTGLLPTVQLAAASSCVPVKGVKVVIGAGVLQLIVSVTALTTMLPAAKVME